MVKKSRLNLREMLLLIFVAVSVVLVGFQWGEALLGEEDNIPDYVRPTAAFEVDESLYDNWNQMDVTPTLHHQRTQEPKTTPTSSQ